MLEDWLRLLYLNSLTLPQKRVLIETFGGAERLFQSSPAQAATALESAGWHGAGVSELAETPTTALRNTIHRDIDIMAQHHASFIPFTDPDYPALLNCIDSAPLGLFYRGDPQLLNRSLIAIVGSRHASPSGRRTARHFAVSLAQRGLGIVSGMALGIDTEAHSGALEIEGPTVAVIATGIDQIYPARNRALHREISARGVVVSEYPPCTPPRKGQFPRRNRIISGLSTATLVVEAGIRSGSLITARLAAEQGREVFAIPGSIHLAGSRGCHYLLRQGAGLVETPEDILGELGDFINHRRNPCDQPHIQDLQLDADQQQVFNLLDFAPCSIEQIIQHSGLTADQVSSILMRLELQGLVSESAGGFQKLPF